MTIALSERTLSVKPSPTLEITAKAAKLKAQGRNIISLSVGEPDFPTPDHVKEAAIQAIHDNITRYTAVDGLPELKQAVVDKFARENQLQYQLNEVIVSAGAKQAIYNLAQAFLNPGDEVIIPAPYWVSYPDMMLLAGAEPVFIEAGVEQNFKMTPQQLAAAITEKTKLLIINSPSNPSGVAYTAEEYKALAAVLMENPHVYIMTDDMYEHILWADEPFCNIVNVVPELKDRTIVVNGVAKAYAMTGWRIGYAAGPAPLISAMKKVQSQSTSNPCSVSQKAAVAALNGPQTCVRTMVEAFKQRHDYVNTALNQMPGVKSLPCQGTFYSFPDVSEAIANMKGMKDDVTFSAFLLEAAEIAVVPGSAFGSPGCIRLSFATDMDTLAEALSRLQTALRNA